MTTQSLQVALCCDRAKSFPKRRSWSYPASFIYAHNGVLDPRNLGLQPKPLHLSPPSSVQGGISAARRASHGVAPRVKRACSAPHSLPQIELSQKLRPCATGSLFALMESISCFNSSSARCTLSTTSAVSPPALMAATHSTASVRRNC